MREYRHVVLALCIALFVFAAFTAVASASYKEIGSGTGTEYKVPFYGLYDYGWSKIIYTQSEIGEAITIDKIAFDVSNTPSSYTVLGQKIYMAHTTDSTFADGSKPDPATMTEVYTGSITWDGSGWHEITLDTSFTYNNADNLLIYYENRDGSYASGGTVEKSSDIRTFHPPRPSNSPRLHIIKVHDQRIYTRFAIFPQQSTNKTRKLPAHQSKIDSHC